MSEESKTAEGDYVMMGSPAAKRPDVPGVNDPSLSQEEKDHRLAVALQQQENAAAFDDHKKKKDARTKADDFRTMRSNTHARLATIRDKDHGMFTVPSSYTTDNAYVKSDGEFMPSVGTSGFAAPGKDAKPQEVEDYKLAAELQKFEQVGAGTVREMEKIVKEEEEAERAQQHRTERSAFK